MAERVLIDAAGGGMAPTPQRFRYGPVPTGFGDLRTPSGAGPHPVVILVHGGYWRARYGLDLMDGLGDDLARRGVASWNIEYRRLGDPGGGWPGTFRDVAAAAERLRALAPEHHLDLMRVVTIGHSAGGHLALWLAARRRAPIGALGDGEWADLTGPNVLPLAGVISQAGVADLTEGWRRKLSNDVITELLGGTPESVPERYAVADPALLLPLGLPQALVHGQDDDIVPIAISRDYAAAAASAGDPAHFRAVPGADHFDIINPRTDAWAVIIDELRAILAPLGPLPPALAPK
ncbi:MAG TPA: alpha/beta hydrolase [Thermomicrobiales bacterium]